MRLALAAQLDWLIDAVHDLAFARGYEVVGVARTPADLEALCQKAHPDVVVTHAVLMEDRDGEDLPPVRPVAVPVLVLCDDLTKDAAAAFISAGAHGVIPSSSDPAVVLDAAACVAAGLIVMNRPVAEVMVSWFRSSVVPNQLGQRGDLTPREMEVLEALSQGLATKTIARKFDVSPKTIENHKTRIFYKLGVHNHAQAVAVALLGRIIDEIPD